MVSQVKAKAWKSPQHLRDAQAAGKGGTAEADFRRFDGLRILHPAELR
jgi:hypothetical protein